MPADAAGSFRLDPSPTAPAQARRVLRDLSGCLVPTEVSETAELLTSELVTNAVTHGRGCVTLQIECDDHRLNVSVGDEHPTAPQVLPEQLLSLGGRGLRLVEMLAGAWGVRPSDTGPGKVVWFQLP